jgi:DNA-binding transcriptional MerR regulator
MIYNYRDFGFEDDYNKFLKIIEGVDESKELDNLADSLSDYLEHLYEKGLDYLEKFLNRIAKQFSWKRGILVFVTILLVTRIGCSLDQVKNMIHIPEKEKSELVEQVRRKTQENRKTLKHFLKDIAQRESSGNYKEINTLGYIGKYQFGKLALKDVGLDKKVDTERFKKNPKIWPEHKQDEAMVKLMRKNLDYLGEYVNRFNGKNVGGIKITISGMLAGSHLLGTKNVKKFLDSEGKYNPTDGYGTKLSEYLNKFSEYKIEL